MKTLAERLKEIRAGRTQSEVAKLLGIKQTAWSRYEKGIAMPGGEMIIHICNTFSVSADWLLGRPCALTSGGTDTNPVLQQKIHDLEVENKALQKALAIVGGHHVQPAKTGGAPAAKIA